MKRQIISIDLILLSNDNPRLDSSFDEDEVILKMVQDQNTKLYELANDILMFGFNPLDTIGIFKSEKYNGFYEVGEGNRRVCALKLLHKPEKLLSINEALYKRFKSLSDKFKIPNEIEVGVFDNESELNHWMKIRHMGEQQGKGLCKWNSTQKSRFVKSQTGSEALIDFWNWIITNNILTESEIASVTKTNWQRILRDKYFSFLKIEFNNGYTVTEENLPIFKERIKCIQKNLGGKTVAIVYDKKKIEEFYNNISLELYGKSYSEIIENESPKHNLMYLADDFSDNEDKKDKSDVSNCKNNYLRESKETDLKNDDIKVGSDKQYSTHTHNNSRDVFNNCSTIIPYAYRIHSSNMRLNKIINELKRLNPDEYPNACGTLLRTLFELSSKVFLEKEENKDFTLMKFMPAIKRAADTLIKKERLTKEQHSAIVNDRENLRLIFNGYMHNTDSYPSSMALKNLFKAHKIFIEECLK